MAIINRWDGIAAPLRGYDIIPGGKITRSLAGMSTRKGKAEHDAVTGESILTFDGITLRTPEGLRVGTSAHKLLMALSAEFLRRNSQGKPPQQRTVSIPLQTWARMTGFDRLEPRPTSSPEEDAAEKKRLKIARDDFAKATNNDLRVLHQPFSGMDYSKGGKLRSKNISFVSASSIDQDDNITVNFTDEGASYLAERHLTQYAIALYAIPDRDPVAYRIGLKLCERYNTINAQTAGTADRIQVKHILDAAALTSIETIRAKHMSWRDRLKEPVETALENLVRPYGVIDSWQYVGAKAVQLTAADVAAMNESYTAWTETYVQFALHDAPDHSAAIQASKIKKSRRTKAGKTTSPTSAASRGGSTRKAKK